MTFFFFLRRTRGGDRHTKKIVDAGVNVRLVSGVRLQWTTGASGQVLTKSDALEEGDVLRSKKEDW